LFKKRKIIQWHTNMHAQTHVCRCHHASNNTRTTASSVCCSVLQCVAVCCSVLRTPLRALSSVFDKGRAGVSPRIAAAKAVALILFFVLCAYNVFYELIWIYTRTHPLLYTGTIVHTATRCIILQHTATHCNTLQHTTTHCNTLQHTAAHCNTPSTVHQNDSTHTYTTALTYTHTHRHSRTNLRTQA